MSGFLPILFLAACHHTQHGVLAPIAQPMIQPESAGSSPSPTGTNSAKTESTTPEQPFPPNVFGDPIYEARSIRDAYFDLDRHDLRADARQALASDAELLRHILSQDPSIKVSVEGHCDERGSAEYNLALGAMRADTAKEFLQNLGVPSAMLGAISYGKERPQCTAQTEECWQTNRRAHLTRSGTSQGRD